MNPMVPSKKRRPQVISTEDWRKLKYGGKNKMEQRPKKARPPKKKYLMKILKDEEKKKIEMKWPRHIDPFKTGDKIWIYMRVGLHTEGDEIQKGTVIAMKGKGNYDSSFTIINNIGRATYEMQFPLWMPQIRKIVKVGEWEGRRRKKMWEIKKMNPSEFQVL